METAYPALNQRTTNRDAGGNTPPPATFTEIYERIFFNDALVKSELEVLLRLIKNKLNQRMMREGAGHTDQAHTAYRKQAVMGRF